MVKNKKYLKSKRAQSQIITTVLIILLVLAAIVIVWNVVKFTIGESTEKVELSQALVTLNLDLESAYISDDGQIIKASVKRGTSGGEIDGIKFILEDSNPIIKLSKSMNIYQFTRTRLF